MSLKLHFLNHSFLRVIAEKDVEHELSDFLTFDAPGMEHMPAYRSGHWDGKVRLYQMRYHTTYTGLALRIRRWAAERGYPCEVDPRLSMCETLVPRDIDMTGLPTLMSLRPYQYDAAQHAIAHRRCVLVFPTGSGKSLITYAILRELATDGKALIVVPTIALVKQMAKMLVTYGYGGVVKTITAGASKDVALADIVISTWQSIYQQPDKWFTQFGTVIGDEAHTFRGKCLSELMGKCITVSNRIALTGTLDGTPVNEWLIEGLFGPVYTTTDTATLIEEGTLATVHIEQIILRHPKGQLPFNAEYRDELNYLVAYKPRNTFIKNLALSLKGVTLALFTLVDTHARMIFEDLELLGTAGRRVVFIHGGTPADDREEVRRLCREASPAILLEFDGVVCRCAEMDEVPLSDGTLKFAKDITLNDDINSNWIINKKM